MKELLVLLILNISYFIGIFVAALSPEELKTAKKYFRILDISILFILSFIFVIDLTSSINLFLSSLIVVLMLLFVFLLSKNSYLNILTFSLFFLILFSIIRDFEYKFLIVFLAIIWAYVKGSSFVCNYYNEKNVYSLKRKVLFIYKKFFDKIKLGFYFSLVLLLLIYFNNFLI